MKGEFKVGDWVYSDTPNVFTDKFKEYGGLVGQVLEVRKDPNIKIDVKVAVDMNKYPFYNGSELIRDNTRYVYCYDGIIRLALPHEIPNYKENNDFVLNLTFDMI